MLALWAAFAAGCAAPVDVVTRMDADGTVVRTAVQPVMPAEGDFQLDVPEPDSEGWDDFARGNGWCRLSGRFETGNPVPAHWTAQLKGGDLTSRNEVRRRVTDCGLFTLYRFEESIGNSVTPGEFRRARAELVELTLPIVFECLDRLFGDEYELGRAKEFVRDSVVPTFERMTERAYEYGKEQPDTQPNPGELIRRTLKPLEDVGLKAEPGSLASPAGKAMARMWAAAKVRELVRKKPDGAELTPAEAMALVERTEDPGWRERAKSVGDAILAVRFGSRQAFNDRCRMLAGRMAGVYGGPLTVFPRLRFAFDLTMPGEIVAGNGERTGPASVRWRFFEHALFPDGYRMWAESAVIHSEPQARMFDGRLPLADAASVAAVRDMLSAAGRIERRAVEAALRDSARAGDLAPLRLAAGSNPCAAKVLARLEN